MEIAAERLSTEKIDLVSYRIALYLNWQDWRGGDRSGMWLDQWDAEIAADKRGMIRRVSTDALALRNA